VSAAILAVSTIGWLVRVAIAVPAGLLIYLVGASTLRKFKIAPDAEPDPEDVVPVDVRFRCTVCGAEVTMTARGPGRRGARRAAPLPGGHGAGRPDRVGTARGGSRGTRREAPQPIRHPEGFSQVSGDE